MKLIAFGVREDEKTKFIQLQAQYHFELMVIKERLSQENVHLVQGFDGVSVLASCDVNEGILKQLHSYNVKVVASRSTGYDNINVDVATSLGIIVSNSTYSPYSVAEFALMLMLMMNRKIIKGLNKAHHHDFSLSDLQGSEMRHQNIGIIGTGKIGATLIKCLFGFGCKLLAYDVIENDDLKGMVEYTDFQTLLQSCDIISLHTPLSTSTKHLINHSSIHQMKEGVVIINTSRGELIDTQALIEGLQEGKIAGAALDVLEEEKDRYHFDLSSSMLDWHNYETLKAMDNVILTQHFSFYTNQAVDDMVTCSVESFVATCSHTKNPYRLN